MSDVLRRCVTALAAALLVGAMAIPAGAVEETVTDVGSFTGSATSSALRIKIGNTEITLAGGDSAAAYERSVLKKLRLRVDSRFVAPCGGGAAAVAGSDLCVSRAELRSINFPNADAETISADALVNAGIASFVADGSEETLRGQDAKASAKGLVVPGLALGEAVCSASKLADEVVAVAVPDQLSPVVTGQIGAAACNVSLENEPSALSASGEIDLALTLTQTLVDKVPQLNDALNQIQTGLAPLPDAVKAPVNNAIDKIQANLEDSPLVRIRVAPNRGTVDGSDSGISSAAPAIAVHVEVLGGLLDIEIGIARTAASVLDGKPEALAETAFVKIKALNVLSSEPLTIEREIAAPQDTSLLAGTPLATNIATSRGVTSTSCPADSGFTTCASASGDAVSVQTLAAPLPTVSVELASSDSSAAAKFTSVKASAVLPVTGALAGTTALMGLGLTAAALIIRRRLR